MLDIITSAVETKTPEGIASAISRLIRGGALRSGERLPTVRDVAAALGVSPATVSNAWQALSKVGLITSRGRAGSYVLEASTAWMPPHFGELAGSHVVARLDLSTGTPDPLLLPDLGLALGHVPTRADTASYLDTRVLPDLEKQLRASWPFVPASLTILDGALDAISRSLEAIVRYGDRVVVESPGFPPFFDLLEQLGVEAIPVAIDSEGMKPELLAAALDLNPAAIIIQPRAQNPTGVSLTEQRMRELARVIRAKSHVSDPVIIEDDHSGEIATGPAFSLGQWFPRRTLHVRSFAKSHGPDLRIGALGGPTSIIDRVVSRRMVGPGWTSRMLQTILYQLLTASPSVTQISEARRVYHARQRALSEALVRAGAEHSPSDGINTWLRVRDEKAAILSLAASGIKVAAGSSFYAVPVESEQFVRITAGRIRDDFDQIGALLAAAARAS
ncbi:aminotransferase class I/II-fold pyridoxal phosphate-dependent enzyme [Agreia pratensis]|uniref:DNA-binding transcriptional regulator, MocR family, contains an aminotransferase domain n=1 Tax=Agreia pratensis TaxID=150121 RepID=A0A1X7I7H1_9MICO|nr:aminotransferase class I/II-fold pyridoxal phosphate-dependent enzyme [Agreia pratensis]MBF4633492.1 aminotransferase class I/II-fold pyridoxal phosphate-dependent enzyme [Agreia pratensis]SMG09809.1 DNA-binding transcriptional regulator, MocR family, contains an aminotransferase domain [Agreia pratensis]